MTGFAAQRLKCLHAIDHAGDGIGDVEDAGELLEHDHAARVPGHRHDVGQARARQRRERQEQQLHPAARVAPGPGVHLLDDDVQVGERPREQREDRGDREHLVEGDVLVLEHVGQHRDPGVEVQRRLEDDRRRVPEPNARARRTGFFPRRFSHGPASAAETGAHRTGVWHDCIRGAWRRGPYCLADPERGVRDPSGREASGVPAPTPRVLQSRHYDREQLSVPERGTRGDP